MLIRDLVFLYSSQETLIREDNNDSDGSRCDPVLAEYLSRMPDACLEINNTLFSYIRTNEEKSGFILEKGNRSYEFREFSYDEYL